MHYADFAEVILRDIDATTKAIEGQVLNGLPDDIYRRALARRGGLLEVRELIVSALGRNETGHPQSR